MGGLSAPALWDATPLAARLQILGVIGFFEFWSEWKTALDGDDTVHYMRGGKPGYFPRFNQGVIFNPLTPLNLFDPFGSPRTCQRRRKPLNCTARSTMAVWQCLAFFLSSLRHVCLVPSQRCLA